MRTFATIALLALAAAPLAAQGQAAKPAGEKPAKAQGSENHPQMLRDAKAGVLPEGWSARLDRGSDMSRVKFVTMAPGWHVTLGPAAIFYRAADRVNGPFHAEATIHQTAAPAHPEGYGLFYGGQALDGEGQKYTYFLVRGDGKFLIKERNGAETRNVTEGWTDHAAVKKQDAEGRTANKLEIDATGEQVRYLVNGQEVHAAAKTPGGTNGIVGLRVNHNLDVHIEGLAVHTP